MNSIQRIYTALRESYPLILTQTGKLEGFTIDVPVICGESPWGKFRLYSEGEFVFGLVLSLENPDGSHIHWHPLDEDWAIAEVKRLMTGEI